MFKNIGFRRQLSIIFSVGMLLLALVSTLVMSAIGWQSVRQRLVDEGLTLTQNFAEQATLSLLYQSEDTAAEAAMMFQAFPDVEGVVILDASGNVLHSLGVTETPANLGDLPDSVALTTDSRHAWGFTTPVFVGQDEESQSPFAEAGGEPELVGYVSLFMTKDLTAD